jgi:hypothetical protein
MPESNRDRDTARQQPDDDQPEVEEPVAGEPERTPGRVIKIGRIPEIKAPWDGDFDESRQRGEPGNG